MPTGDMWGPASEPGSPPISSNRRQHRRRKGKTAKQRHFNWIVGVLLLLILLAIGDHQKPTSSSPTSTSSSPAATSVDVSVVKSGFTQNTKTVVDLISYGLILRNNNSDLTALDVKVTTTFLDSFGQPLDTDVKTVTGIPPLSTFDVGGSIAPNISVKVARLGVTVKVGGSTTKRFVLPIVTSVVAIGDFGLCSVAGTMRNPYTRVLPSDATVFIVYVNAHGFVVGGDNEPTGAAVSPGATVAFTDSLLSMTISKATIVRASVDPDGFPVPGSGTIQWTTS